MKKPLVNTTQKGVVLVFVALALVAMLGMAGLAIDLGHSYAIKTRLQNAVDAAALAAASAIYRNMVAHPGQAVPVTITNSLTNPTAIDEAKGTFRTNLDTGSFWGLERLPNNINVAFCVSPSLQNFDVCLSTIPASTPGTPNVNFFIRATAVDNGNVVDLRPFIIQVLGIHQKSVGASAVAGLQVVNPAFGQPICNLAPMFVCSNTPNGTTEDDNCSNDNNGDGVNDCFGRDVGKTYYIKASSDCPPAPGSKNWTCPAEPKTDVALPITRVEQLERITTFDTAGANANNGNFMLINFLNADGTFNNGAKNVRESVVNSSGCFTSTIKTEPGDVSSIQFPFNAIFNEGNIGDLGNDPAPAPGIYQDLVTTPYPLAPGTSYKPYMIDHKETGPPTSPTITETIPNGYTQARVTFAQYNAAYTAAGYDTHAGGNDRSYRRVFGMPVANCGASKLNGSETLPLTGLVCFFLPENIQGNGNMSYLLGELIPQDNCGFTDNRTVTGGDVGSQVEIVLYDDYMRNDE